MKKNNKKGFTIVELVIVVAVIAILAGVLIPTFSSIVGKARLSADQQTVRQLNVALQTADHKVESYTQMGNVLEKQGYIGTGTLVPSSKGYSYYWVADYNMIVLVKDGKVVFPEDSRVLNKPITTLDAMTFHASNYVMFAGTVEDVKLAIANGNSLVIDTKLDEAIVLDAKYEVHGEVVYDLGGNTIVQTKNRGSVDSPEYVLDNYGTLTIKNGTLEGRGVQNFGTLTLGEGAVIKCTSDQGGACVWNEGELIVDGAKLLAVGGDAESKDTEKLKFEPAVINNQATGTVTIKAGEFKSENSGAYAILNNGGTMTIGVKDGDNADITVTSWRGCIGANGGKLTINAGTFKQTGANAGGYALYIWNDSSVEVVINGGVFEAANTLYAKSVEDGADGNAKITNNTTYDFN